MSRVRPILGFFAGIMGLAKKTYDKRRWGYEKEVQSQRTVRYIETTVRGFSCHSVSQDFSSLSHLDIALPEGKGIL